MLNPEGKAVHTKGAWQAGEGEINSARGLLCRVQPMGLRSRTTKGGKRGKIGSYIMKSNLRPDQKRNDATEKARSDNIDAKMHLCATGAGECLADRK